MASFTFNHIFEPYVGLGIMRDLGPDRQSLFMILAYILSEIGFPDDGIMISNKKIKEFSPLSYAKIEKTRMSLLAYEYDGEKIIFCENLNEKNELLYKINKELFSRLYQKWSLVRNFPLAGLDLPEV